NGNIRGTRRRVKLRRERLASSRRARVFTHFFRQQAEREVRERLKRGPPDSVSGSHEGFQNGRSGQERFLRSLVPLDLVFGQHRVHYQEHSPWHTHRMPATADASPPGGRPTPSSASSAARTSICSRVSWASPPPPCRDGGTTSWPAARPRRRAVRPTSATTRSPGCAPRSAS